MYSQCPNCLARFRVTVATLRAAHGRARCGHCGHKFDILERLTEEKPAGSEPSPPESPAAGALVAPTLTATSLPEPEPDAANVGNVDLSNVSDDIGPEDYHFSAADIEKVFIDARDWQKQYGARLTSPSAETAEPVAPEASEFEVDEPEGVEDITLEGLKVEIESDTGESTHLEAEFDYEEDDEDAADVDGLDETSRVRMLEDVPDSAYPAEEADLDEDSETRFYRALIEGRDLPPTESGAAGVAAGAAAVATVRAGAAVEAPMRAELRSTPAERWSTARRARVPDDDLSELDLTRSTLPVPRSGRKWLGLGSLLLGLVLGAQVVHHFRQDIVRNPQAGAALRQVYAALGLPLSPDWDLDAFELRQWGPNEDVAPGAALTVRASLTNGAAHAQPYPLLRLTFEDRFGSAVAQRDFMPSEYLKSAPQAVRQLAAGESTEAELSVVAPGADAVGFRLDACLREAAGQVRCAHGTG